MYYGDVHSHEAPQTLTPTTHVRKRSRTGQPKAEPASSSSSVCEQHDMSLCTSMPRVCTVHHPPSVHGLAQLLPVARRQRHAGTAIQRLPLAHAPASPSPTAAVPRGLLRQPRTMRQGAGQWWGPVEPPPGPGS